jgi:hypothetical protein
VDRSLVILSYQGIGTKAGLSQKAETHSACFENGLGDMAAVE